MEDIQDVYEEEMYNEDIENDELTEEEILAIQEEYRKRRLMESLVGPVVSTVFHVVLVIVLAILITDKVKEPVAEIKVVMEDVKEVEIEPPPEVEEPEPIEKPEETTNPVLTTVALENIETNDAALEDTNDEAPSTEDNMTEQAVSDVVVSPSAFASPTVYGGRSAAGRAAAVSNFGGSKVGQNALLKALWWLKKVQNPDGSWGSTGKAAHTGLALLTFLAHGETPTSKNFGATVKKAMKWLANDPIDTNSYHAYPHAIKTYALAEAYAMTGVSMLSDKMDACVKVIVEGQQNGGSYHYNYNKSENIKQDLSFAGWNYQALKAAYGAGCETPGITEAIYKAIEWLKTQGGSNDYGDGFPYAIKNGKRKVLHAHTMRAVGSLCLQLFGEGKTPEIRDEIEKISDDDLKNYDWENPPKASLYGWYYATQVMFQEGGAKWRKWNRKFQKVLTENQHPEGYWNYPGRGHGKGDPLTIKVYATTLSALQLTVYYRYLPSSKGAIGNKDIEKAGENKEEDPMKEEGLDLVQ